MPWVCFFANLPSQLYVKYIKHAYSNIKILTGGFVAHIYLTFDALQIWVGHLMRGPSFVQKTVTTRAAILATNFLF